MPGVERFRTLLPTDISVRPEDFLKCLKWNKTYPVISSISWLNPLTQETNVSNEVRKKRSSRENSFNLEAFFSPHIKNFWIASPQPFRRIKHQTLYVDFTSPFRRYKIVREENSSSIMPRPIVILGEASL